MRLSYNHQRFCNWSRLCVFLTLCIVAVPNALSQDTDGPLVEDFLSLTPQQANEIGQSIGGINFDENAFSDLQEPFDAATSAQNSLLLDINQFQLIGDFSGCAASLLNRNTPLAANGSFFLGGVVIQPNTFARVRVVCSSGDGSVTGGSDFFEVTQGGEIDLPPIVLGNIIDRFSAIRVDVQPNEVSPGEIASVTVTATRDDGSEEVLAPNADGLSLMSSNALIADIQPDQRVTAGSSGRALVSAQFDGLVATTFFSVSTSIDSDDDGIPDDFEQTNSFNPGGANLSLMPGVAVEASSSQIAPENVVDGNAQTSWSTALGDGVRNRTSPSIRIIFPTPVDVGQVRVVGSRSQPFNFQKIVSGVLTAYDSNGQVVFNSDVLALTEPNRDATIVVARDDVQSVKFVSVEDEASTGTSLAEIQVLAAAGGRALDSENAADALEDFDFDGLSNLEEFTAGSSIFSSDTDSDLIPDQVEIEQGSSPFLADSDSDGLADGDERNPFVDIDRDGLANVLDPDSDNDGLPDGVELEIGTDPQFNFSESQGDADGDLLNNIDEILESTDPGNPDTDGDDLSDGEELLSGQDGMVTNPRLADSDGDGMLDGFEAHFGLNPLDASDAQLDPDDDGLTSLEESQLLFGSNPTNNDRIGATAVMSLPEVGTSNFSVNSALVIRFSEPLIDIQSDRPLTAERLFEPAPELFGGLYLGGELIESIARNARLSDDGLSLSLQPENPLKPNTPYLFVVRNLPDRAYNKMQEEFLVTFETGEAIDNVSPVIVATSVDGIGISQPIPPNAPLTVQFSEAMDPASFIAGADFATATWTLTDFATGRNLISGTFEFTDSGKKAVFTPTIPLPVGTTFRLVVRSGAGGLRDISQNPLNSPFFQRVFTTGYHPDEQSPELIAVSPLPNSAEAPINSIITAVFSEAIDPTSISAENSFGPDASISFADGNRRLLITSDVALPRGRTFQVILGSGIQDNAGNALANPTEFMFSTSNIADLNAPFLLGLSPSNGLLGMPTNVVVQASFNERIDPTSFLGLGGLQLVDTVTGQNVPGEASVSNDGSVVTLVPSVLLQPRRRYEILINTLGLPAVTDIAGNLMFSRIGATFTTGNNADLNAPQVLLASLRDGDTNLPVNARIRIRWDDAILPSSLASDRLAVSSEGVPVEGRFELVGDDIVEFVPGQQLPADASIQVSIAGLSDLANNIIEPFEIELETLPSVERDEVAPQVVSSFPASGATSVPTSIQAEVVFSEQLDETTVIRDNVYFRDRITGARFGSPALEGDRIVISSDVELPGGRDIGIALAGITDLSGNVVRFNQDLFFTTVQPVTVERPVVASITPVSGTEDVNPASPITLIFSKPIDPSTVNESTVSVFRDGISISRAVSFSLDNTMLVLTPQGGASLQDSLLSVVVSTGVTSLEGEPIESFTSNFRTSRLMQRGRPAVVSARPGVGEVLRADVQVSLFMDVPIHPLTVDDGFHVAVDGVTVEGSTDVSADGTVITFTPSQPFASGSVVQYFVTDRLLSHVGDRAFSAQGQFRVFPDATTPPVFVNFNPIQSQGLAPRNSTIDLLFSKPLNPSSVNSESIVFYEQGGETLSASLTLSASGRSIRVVPDSELENDRRYAVLVGNVESTEGVMHPLAKIFGVVLGSENDVEAPIVTSIIPSGQSRLISTNASITLRFNESINPVSVLEGETLIIRSGDNELVSCTVTLSEFNTVLRIVPNAPLPANSAVSVTLAGIEDQAGNDLERFESFFHTGAAPDLERPEIFNSLPKNLAESVPINAIIALQASEAINPFSILPSLALRDLTTFEFVDGQLELGGSGELLTFTPDELLVPNRRYRVELSNLTDVVGNSTDVFEPSFSTGISVDSVSPTVVQVSPFSGAVNVPPNAQISIAFNEPVVFAAGSKLLVERNGEPTPFVMSIDGASRHFQLRPISPMQVGNYTVTISGAQDQARNVMVDEKVFVFSVIDGIDFNGPNPVATSPVDNATEVSPDSNITILFDESIDPTTLSLGSAIRLINQANFEDVAVDVSVSPDGQTVMLSPKQLLDSQTPYTVVTTAFGSNALVDFAGNGLHSVLSISFTTQ